MMAEKRSEYPGDVDRRSEWTEDPISEEEGAEEDPFAAYEHYKEANRRFRKELARSISTSKQ